MSKININDKEVIIHNMDDGFPLIDDNIKWLPILVQVISFVRTEKNIINNKEYNFKFFKHKPNKSEDYAFFKKLKQKDFKKKKNKTLISLMWTNEETELKYQLPHNLIYFSFLLFIVAKEFNMTPHLLIGSLGNCYMDIFKNQKFPTLEFSERLKNEKNIFDNITSNDFYLKHIS